MIQTNVIQSKAPSIRLKIIVNMLPIIGLMLFYYTHYIEGTFSFFIPLGMSMFWLIQSVLISNMNEVLFNKISVWWMAYLFICVLMVIIGFSSNNLNFIISRLPFYLIPMMGYYVIKNYNRKEKNIILILFLLIFFVNLVYNIYLGFLIPELFEDSVHTEETEKLDVLMNKATTGFIIVGYWLIGALLMVLLTTRRKLRRLICILLMIPIGYYMLFQNTRGTAILLLMVELVGMFLAYYEPTRQVNRRIYYVFSVVTIVLLLLLVFIPLMEWLIANLQSERLAKRLNDLIEFRQSRGNVDDVSDGSFTSRVMLAQISLNSFLSSPISIMIGIGDHTQSFGGDLVKSGIGNHSEFIDVLGRYGLVGAFVFWKIMKSYYQMLRSLTTNRNLLKYVNILFVVIILSGFFNGIFYPLMLIFLFLIYPIIIEITDHKNKISYSNGR